MFSLLDISPENVIWFYLAPLFIFGPIFFGLLWNFGLKNIFFPPKKFEEQQRLEREQAEHISQRRQGKAGDYERTEHAATHTPAGWAGQAVIYGFIAIVLGGFSAWPVYRYTVPGMAQVKLSLSHPGLRVVPCRKHTAEERAALAPNMRAKMKCSRERWPVAVELSFNGEVVYSGVSAAAGLRHDGSSSFYEKFSLPAGSHVLMVRLNDAGPQSSFTRELTQSVELRPAQNLVIGFAEGSRGFYIK